MVRQQLAGEFELENEKLPKPIVCAGYEYTLLRTLWSSLSLIFNHERLRVQLALIAQLAGMSGNRPGALLALWYGNLKITLLHDPLRVHRPNITLKFTFKKTKSYSRPNDAQVPCLQVAKRDEADIIARNTYPILEICKASCLPCSPQVALIGLMFADDAFERPNLTEPDKLFSLRFPQGLQQLSAPIKESLASTPVSEW
ncbi:hypothetical protein LTR22_023305 [Elasticomyces elasticus]|nr:hypothetical protein LTR22_023305 [Elasticomyces elasticus]